MNIISIISQKGGAGKTTLAINLALASLLNKKMTAIIDLDPQASASQWGDQRDDDNLSIVSAQASRLPNIVETAKEMGVKLCIIDTAPHSESSALAAARISDLILVPCRPAILDLRAIGNTVDLIKIANKKAFAVLNSIPVRGSLADEAETAISNYNIEVCPIKIAQRADYIHSLTASKSVQEYSPKGQAAIEVKNLYKWVLKQL